MKDDKEQIEKLMEALQERAKELNCLYRIEELLNEPDRHIPDIAEGILEAIPPGWQYPNICHARLIVNDKAFYSPNFTETPWVQSADIIVQGKRIGSISVYYAKEMPEMDDGPFLKEETKLIHTIADRISHYISYHRMKEISREYDSAKRDLSEHKRAEWQVVLDLVRGTDKNLYVSIAHKMLNYLCWTGIKEAEDLRRNLDIDQLSDQSELERDSNRPHRKRNVRMNDTQIQQIFDITNQNMSDGEILNLIQKWIQEDKLSFLVQVVNRNLSLSEVADAIRRFHHTETEGIDLQSPGKRGVKVSLIRRFLSDQLHYINIAKQYIEIGDFYHLLQKMIFSAESHGKLGGKSAGLYLAAQILKKSTEYAEVIGDVKIPKTWHITSDMLLHFMHYNNFDEIVEQKYKDINQIRYEYPHVVHTFKNSLFPPEMVKGLSVALDDFGDSPLIVRSSSLLEDRMGAAFSGKYKSLFLANQGSKQERLEALTDAIAEVYASTFSPDPIEYRSERGLIDFGEEMGIMIQEVVGNKIGNYFLPTFAGVAFSNNEFRWSPRIKRSDGLLRIVPGLGTRAVDRLSNDYPILNAPGQPNLRVNPTAEESVKYSPKYLDVINLETNTFETIEISVLLKKYGSQIPGINKLVSIYSDGLLRKPMGFNIDFENDDIVVTGEGLFTDQKYIKKMHTILTLLEEKLETPVDIEFASDGKDFYLLQCRPQSYSAESLPAPIPKDLPEEDMVFSANRYISNGRVNNITHIVYIDPDQYAEINDDDELLDIGRAVGKLNKLLPKRQFILMGPGRWGSRGDIKLGVTVTYSDINNTAVLIEIARRKGNYVPDLSFGTHFFQDLVEANIRYLPLYPDDEGIVFNDRFLSKSTNIIPDFLPDYAHLENVIKLIDVPQCSYGRNLQILMNADLDEAVAILADSSVDVDEIAQVKDKPKKQQLEHYWRWRMNMAQLIAENLDAEEFGVKALYIFGSTKNATAGPGSDIDLLVHVNGDEKQRELLDTWFEGLNVPISEMNYLRTGYRTDKILDIHYVTDEDIANQTSYAVKIGAVTDAARPLELKNKTSK